DVEFDGQDPPVVSKEFDDPESFAHGFVDREAPYRALSQNQKRIDLPRWVQPKKIEAGHKFFETYSMEICSALFCASLPLSYTAARGSRVLLETAQLVSNVGRRIEETGQLLFHVMQPDPNRHRDFEPGSRSYTTVLTVRG